MSATTLLPRRLTAAHPPRHRGTSRDIAGHRGTSTSKTAKRVTPAPVYHLRDLLHQHQHKSNINSDSNSNNNNRNSNSNNCNSKSNSNNSNRSNRSNSKKSNSNKTQQQQQQQLKRHRNRHKHRHRHRHRQSHSHRSPPSVRVLTPPSVRASATICTCQCHHQFVPTPRTSACALAHLQPATPHCRHQQAKSVPAAPSAPTAPASSSTKIELPHSFAWLHSSAQGRRSGVCFCPAPPQRCHLPQELHRASTVKGSTELAPHEQRHHVK